MLARQSRARDGLQKSERTARRDGSVRDPSSPWMLPRARDNENSAPDLQLTRARQRPRISAIAASRPSVSRFQRPQIGPLRVSLDSYQRGKCIGRHSTALRVSAGLIGCQRGDSSSGEGIVLHHASISGASSSQCRVNVACGVACGVACESRAVSRQCRARQPLETGKIPTSKLTRAVW